MRALWIALLLGLTACSNSVSRADSPPPEVLSSPDVTAVTSPEPTASATSQRQPAKVPEIGDFVLSPERKQVPLATWSGNDLEGNPVTTASLTGQITVVNFWASWCGPCRQEWPILTSASTRFPDVKFVGINTQDSLEKAKSWVAENPTSYPHFFDANAEIKASLTTVPNMGMPITVILNSEGKIFAWYSGPITAKSLNKVLG